MYGLTKEELKVFKKLNSPKKIQDFLNNLDTNFEEKGETYMSPRKVLKEKKCHCIEAATFAALALKIHKRKPLILDLTGTKNDWDHVIAVFKKQGKWGAISKTNHAVLGYRDPVYNSIHELVMSFFHEYTNETGSKTLRSYSNPVDLSQFDNNKWETDEEDLWYICNYLAKIKHFPILTKKQISNLRKSDEIEIFAGNLIKQQDPKKAKQNNFYTPLNPRQLLERNLANKKFKFQPKKKLRITTKFN